MLNSRHLKSGSAFSLFCFILILIIDGCETSDQYSPIEPAHQWFEHSVKLDSWDALPKGTTVKTIRWEKAIAYSNVVEVPVIMEGQVSARSYGEKNIDGTAVFRLLIWREKESFTAAMVQLITQTGDLPRTLIDVKDSRFNGMILINLGGSRKYVTIYEIGVPIKRDSLPLAREQSWQCYTVCERSSIVVGSYSKTTLHCSDYCYDDTEWQVPLPPEGGGTQIVFDYGSVTGGAGSSGPWTSAFPSSPNNGDFFELTDPSGIVTKYRYNTSTNAWEVYEVKLPINAVSVHADRYPFLQNIPSDFNVFGTDGFLYKYSESLMSWVGVIIGDKPIFEYTNKCQGLKDIWNNYPNNEVSGYITQDGQLLVINVLSFTGGRTSGTYTYGGITYYPYPISQGLPTNTYQGLIQTAGYYLIPVVASVHTHTPCRNDGTNGVSHAVGSDDRNRAAMAPNIQHWVIGCGAIAQFNNDENFFNIQAGSLDDLCINIR